MQIAVNTRFLLKDKLEGIGRFTDETLRLIVKDHPEHTFHLLFDRAFDESFIYGPNVVPHILFPPARHPFLWYIWFEWRVHNALQKIKPAAFFSPDGFLPLRSDAPSVPVIHDLNFEHYPQDLPFLPRKYYEYYMPRFAKKATRIATVSNYSAKDISLRYGISPDKIDVVYNGASKLFHPETEIQNTATRKRFSNNCPYFLYIGSLHARKNIPNLLKSFALFKERHSCQDKLLLVGAAMWGDDLIAQAIEHLDCKEDIAFTGRLNDVDLAQVLAAAQALTYVPYFEGFGIPIIEAMNCKIPVITSNVTSMPEVAGEAALLVDPFSISQISDAMHLLSTNPTFRLELAEAGFRQAQLFSWQQTADKTWNCIEKALDHA